MTRDVAMVLSVFLVALSGFFAATAGEPRTVVGGAGWAGVWADRQIGEGVRQGHASAAVVSVVQDGRTVLLKGYGVADHPGGRVVDPSTDQFQIASVSKTFTAALLSQMIDAGRVRGLDAPVTDNLKRSGLPVTDGRPITFRMLVTHSAGFEEQGFGYFAHERSAIPASGDYLKRALPAQVRKPGERIVYANIDPALVGAAIEDTSGRALQELMDARLFRPLGMTHSVLNYAPDGGGKVVKAFAGGLAMAPSFNNPFFAPTGSVQTTGQDMAAYMNAVLGLRPDILSQTAVARLTSPQFTNDPALDPLGMYWFLTKWGPVGVVEHAGGLPGAAAWVILVPERKLGVFIAWAGGAPPLDYGVLHDSFLAAALGPPPAPAVAALANTSLADFAGRYRDERRAHTTPEVLFSLGADTHSVTQAGGGLYIGSKGPYLETAPGVFTLKAKPGRLGDTVVFRGDEMLQRVGYARKVSGWRDSAVQQLVGLIALCLVVSGLLAIFWPRGWPKAPAIAGGLTGLTIPMAIFLPGVDRGLEAAMQAGSALRFDLISGAMMVLAVCAAALATGIMFSAGPDWSGGIRRRAAFLHSVTLIVGQSVMVLVLVSWNFTRLMWL